MMVNILGGNSSLYTLLFREVSVETEYFARCFLYFPAHETPTKCDEEANKAFVRNTRSRE